MPQTVEPISATPVDWYASLAPVFAGTPPPSGQVDFSTYAPRGFSASATPSSLFAVTRQTNVGASYSSEMWVASPNLQSATKVATESNLRLTDTAWSPDSRWIAYTAESTSPSLGRADARVYVVDTQTGIKTLVAQNGAAAPQWSPDGTKLFFCLLQASPSPGWKPYRVTVSTGGISSPVLAADVLFPAPAYFSPDTAWIAGYSGQGLLCVNLTSGAQAEQPLNAPFELSALQWSPDSQWVYASGFSLRILPLPISFALQPATGAVVSLNEPIGSISPPDNDECLEVAGAGWMPGYAHQILLCVRRIQAGGCSVLPVTLETSWQVYDVESGFAADATGLAPPDPDDPFNVLFSQNSGSVQLSGPATGTLYAVSQA